MRLITRIMHGEEADWIQLLTALVQSSCSGWRDRAQEDFRIQEFLLLGPKPLWKTAKTVKWVLAGWYKAREKLRFIRQGSPIPYRLELWKLEILERKADARISKSAMNHWKTLRPIFRRCEIHTIQDLFMQNGRRRLLPGLDREIEQNGEALTHLENLERWLGQTVLTEGQLEESRGWTWMGDNGSIKSWAAPNSTWRRILAPRVDEEGWLHDKWPGSGSENEWHVRWRKLWNSPHSEKNKLWFWRLYRHAFQ
ncbi:hypothetical protein R1sor_026868 [Riccia sorocarpa]|uniref:Uncharacterized protein n=1 Tax=Riccia sorocarpa TaxID=122646 RepID=A0ABD3GCN2_9MARC